MRYLADSHVIYWALVSPDKLALSARQQLIDGDNDFFVSSASLWELQLKASKGKLDLPTGFVETLREQFFEELPVSWAHAQATSGLPMIHGDPFDRMLIAQALTEGLTLMTRDKLIRRYRVPVCIA